ncbi:MAG: sterol desaturase family protein [Deltaproteobacteria bacterium]|nr:sterol desaturase family protein [Deltaproteobacteria bacterium]
MTADQLRSTCFVAGLVLFGLLEWLEPRAPLSEPRRVRWTANLGLAALNAIVLRLQIGAIFFAWVIWVERQGIGLFGWLTWPGWVEVLLTVVLLDYSFYLFHQWLMHRWPFGWRFHKVHHTDLNLDVTTASRFHLGELIISMLYTAIVVAIIGAPLAGVVAYEAAKLAAAQFNHSRLRLPRRFERVLGWVVVTPAIHWLHHSWEPQELNSNYSNIFSLWDRIFRTFRGEADESKLVLGLKGHREGNRLRLPDIFAIPFR